MKLSKIKSNINKTKPRSAWDKGVKRYALEMLAELAENGYSSIDNKKLKDAVLNGAKDFKDLANSGLYLVANADIAKRLCSPSQYKKMSMSYMAAHCLNWQKQALYQAYLLIRDNNVETIKKK